MVLLLWFHLKQEICFLEVIIEVSSDFFKFIIEKLELIGTIASNKMFGSAGICINNLTVEIIVNKQPYFKVDNTSLQNLRKRG